MKVKDYFMSGRIFSITTATPANFTNLIVEVLKKSEGTSQLLGSSLSDSDGNFTIQFSQENNTLNADTAIFFQLIQDKIVVFSNERESQKINWNSPSFAVIPSSENSAYQIQLIAATAIERPNQPAERSNGRVVPARDQVIDILPTADQIGRFSPSTSCLSYEGKGGSLQQILDSALIEVLGVNFNATDGKGLRESLTQTFTPKETKGRVSYEWTPRTYTTTQTELGGTVSGGQASLYHRAKAAGNDALRLLDKLYALNPAGDPQNIEAMRAVVRTEVMELVEEMGAKGGPRVQRVNTLFELLLGSNEDENPNQNLGGQLQNLAEVFGLSHARVNTVDEEQNYSNYLIVRDYIISLKTSWSEYIGDSQAGLSLGTQLVLLSQALSVVVESVQEVYRIMDLVFLGPAERQSVFIDFTKVKDREHDATIAFKLPDNSDYMVTSLYELQPPMSVEGLLDWALRFGRDEGPALAKAGGKLGIKNAIAGTAERLMKLTLAASYANVHNTAFQREGVRRALRDLAFQLYQVQRLADSLTTPAIYDLPAHISGKL